MAFTTESSYEHQAAVMLLTAAFVMSGTENPPSQRTRRAGVHPSSFTIHYSPFTIHYSPFTIHHSPNNAPPLQVCRYSSSQLSLFILQSSIFSFKYTHPSPTINVSLYGNSSLLTPRSSSQPIIVHGLNRPFRFLGEPCMGVVSQIKDLDNSSTPN